MAKKKILQTRAFGIFYPTRRLRRHTSTLRSGKCDNSKYVDFIEILEHPCDFFRSNVQGGSTSETSMATGSLT